MTMTSHDPTYAQQRIDIMAENRTEESISSDMPRPPARRSGRNRRTTPLAKSFKELIDETPADEVRDLSNQLQQALGSIANGPDGNNDAIDVTASCIARVESSSDKRLPSNPQRMLRPMSITNLESMNRRPSGDEYYAPKSSSRRNSRAGSELAMSMKLSAQRMLAELGEISDDDDDPILLGGLDGLREESLRGIMREDSQYSPHE